MTKIYTRKGDNGMTVLGNGQWVAKASFMLEFYGCIDELNAYLGWAVEAILASEEREKLNPVLRKIYHTQRKLFSLNQQLTVKQDRLGLLKSRWLEKSANKAKLDGYITANDILELEAEIDAISDKLPPLESFILPGGGEVAARIHIARTICRRVERVAFMAVETNKALEVVAIYLNRLSDWLFVVARLATFVANIEEVTV